MKKLIFIIILIPLILFAQNLTEDSRIKDAFYLIEQWIESQMAYEDIPGVSVAIVYKQDVIWHKGFGFANPENKIPVTAETIYSICSISKLFTSIALMQLRDQGLLRLDDPVSKHLPWFNIEQVYPDSPPITIESILTHCSGLPRESDFPYWNFPKFDFPTRQQMIDQLKLQKTLYPAFTYYQYSNLGLTLAGEIVARVSGKDYDAYVTKHIIKPLGLNNTRLELPKDLHANQLAIGYSAKKRDGNRDKLPFFETAAITPAAGFSSTAEDLAKFAKWQLRLLKTGNTEILAANTLKEMHRVHWLDPDWSTTRGLGFGVYRHDDITFVGHSGECPGYNTSVMIQPQDEIAVIFMMNSLGSNAAHFAREIYQLIKPVISQVENAPEEDKNINPEFLKFCGTYTFDPWGGEVAVVPWHGKLAMAYFPDNDAPTYLTKLKHIESNKFQRIRDNGEPAEEIIFITGKKGEIESIRQHSSYWKKIK